MRGVAGAGMARADCSDCFRLFFLRIAGKGPTTTSTPPTSMFNGEVPRSPFVSERLCCLRRGNAISACTKCMFPICFGHVGLTSGYGFVAGSFCSFKGSSLKALFSPEAGRRTCCRWMVCEGEQRLGRGVSCVALSVRKPACRQSQSARTPQGRLAHPRWSGQEGMARI